MIPVKQADHLRSSSPCIATSATYRILFFTQATDCWIIAHLNHCAIQQVPVVKKHSEAKPHLQHFIFIIGCNLSRSHATHFSQWPTLSATPLMHPLKNYPLLKVYQTQAHLDFQCKVDQQLSTNSHHSRLISHWTMNSCVEFTREQRMQAVCIQVFWSFGNSNLILPPLLSITFPGFIFVIAILRPLVHKQIGY